MNEVTAAVTWSDELSVGIQEIDEQHKVLVSILNEMHDAVRHNHGPEASLAILDRLIEYTKIHFAVEESLFRIFDYPGYEDHHAEHAALLKEAQIMRAKVVSGESKVSFKLLHFLRMWLTEHIMGSDMDYADYLLKKGIKAKSGSSSWFNKLWH